MQLLLPKNLWFVAGVSLVFGILFNVLFFNKNIGISFFVYFGLLMLALFILLNKFQISYNKKTLWYLAPILFFSLMVGVRDSEFLLFWNVVLTFALVLLLTHHLVGRSIRNILFLDYLQTGIVLPLNMVGKSFSSIGRLLSSSSGVKEGGKLKQIIKGIIITLPVIVVFLILLSSADLVFKQFLGNLISFHISEEKIAQLILAIFFTFVWLGFYTYILENVNEQEVPAVPEQISSFKLGTIEAQILFGTLNFIFLLFVAVQIRYLFAGHSAITTLGFTYAEYAHKGFGELVVVALLTFGLVLFAERFVEKKESSHMGWFKIFISILVALTLLIMASAFIRLTIYEQAYSLTFLRVLVQAFIIWLAVVFLWLEYKILFKVNNRKFVFGVFGAVVAFFVLFNLINVDAFIARENINKFAKSGKLDTEYLATLSADATPEIAKLINMSGITNKEGKELPVVAKDILEQKYNKYKFSSWQEFVLSRYYSAGVIKQALGKQ